MDDKIKDKIMKMLRLAESPNQHEAEAALAKAKAMAAQHNLDIFKLAQERGEDPQFKIGIRVFKAPGSGPFTEPLYYNMACALGWSFDCRLVYAKRKNGHRYTFVGTEADMEMIAYCWEWLAGVFKKLFSEYRKANVDPNLGSSVRWRMCRCFYEGLAQGIFQANKRVVENNTDFALVLVSKKSAVEEYYDNHYGNLKSTARAKLNDHNARTSGRLQGRNIKLVKGVQGTAHRQLGS